jgi:hypothetical protein
VFLTLFLSLSFTACAKNNISEPPFTETPPIIDEEEPADPDPMKPMEDEDLRPPFEGKIAIITNDVTGNCIFYSAKPVIEKYGEDKIIHFIWPVHPVGHFDEMISLTEKLAADPEIKAIVVNSAFWGTNGAFEKLRETRKDIYVIFCAPEMYSGSDYPQTAELVTQTADLILHTDMLNMGSAIVQQAYKLGAETFVYYSSQTAFISSPYIERLELIKQTCNELSIKFVEAHYPPSAGGYWEEVAFIRNDILSIIDEYGKNTAIFPATSYMDVIVGTIINAGAICPQAGTPSYFDGLFGDISDLMLGPPYPAIVEDLMNYCEAQDITEVMGQPYPLYSEYFMPKARQHFAKYDMQGRLSAWPVEPHFMYTVTAAEYAVKWINGEVPKEGVDVVVLKQLMEDFAGVEVWLTPHVDDGIYDYNKITEPTGKTYDNFLMMRMDYITF